MIAASSTSIAITLTIAGAILLIAAGGAIAWRARRPRQSPDIPDAMRPGPSDPDLEKPLLEKLQGWGIALTVFFMLWVPFTLLNEPDANAGQQERIVEAQIELGSHIVQPFSEENQAGFDCMRCHGVNLKGQEILAGDAVVRSADLTTVCSRKTVDEITTTIKEGQGEVMPSWGIEFKGAMNDQQVQALVQYIITIQDPAVVTAENNKCLNPDVGATPAAEASPAADGESPAADAESPAADAESPGPVDDAAAVDDDEQVS